MRGVTSRIPRQQRLFEFQLTRLMRGVTSTDCITLYAFVISTHTPHARRDLLSPHIIHYDIRFQLTRLMRGVT